jgi:hypothetical protein
MANFIYDIRAGDASRFPILRGHPIHRLDFRLGGSHKGAFSLL